MTPKMIFNSVHKNYQQKKKKQVSAVADFSLDIKKGEFVSLVGPSGCGKSTLLRIAAGIAEPSSGTADLYPDSATASRPLCATVFQDYSIFPWFTVHRNLTIVLEAIGIGAVERGGRAVEWLDRVGLSGFGTSYPNQLSGGMQQRVALARALVVDPEILLMDEPFAALDAQMRKLLGDQLLDICQTAHKTVLFVTHSLQEAILLSDRVVLMTARPGRVKAVYDVPLPRPRDAAVRSGPQFAALEELIWNELREEVEATMVEEGAPA